MKLAFRPVVPVLVLAPFFACGGDKGSGVPMVGVEEAWARAIPLVQEEGGARINSAVYFLLRNQGTATDRMIGAETPIAVSAEIHESILVDDVMRMRRVDGVEILPGAAVELQPGSLHIMLMGLEKPLLAGEVFDLTLHFERSGDLTVAVPVRPAGGV
jgi:copper(I)-binding protein